MVRIVRFLNSRSKNLGSDFLIAFDDTLARLEKRFQEDLEVRYAPKFGDVYGEPIIAEKVSPSSAKRFKDYFVFYILNEEKQEAVVLAVEYGPKNPDFLIQLLSKRK